MGTALILLGVLLLFVGFPASIIWLIIRIAKKQEKKKQLILIASSFVASFALMIIGSSIYSETDEYKENSVQENVMESAQEEDDGQNAESQTSLAEENEENEVAEQIIPEIEYEDVFLYDLIENMESYNGRYVRTVFQVDSCYQRGDEAYISSEYPDYNLVQTYSNIIVYPSNYKEIKEGTYITVEGIAKLNASQRTIIDANITDEGKISQRRFEEDLTDFKTKREDELLEVENAFRESCESCTYDDLYRYPDTYKETKIVVNIKIIRTEPDGIIFDGEIEGQLEGKSVSIVDGRNKKEPKLMEGDTVTIYGYGNGLTTVKVQDTSGLIPKTVDKYDIPSIKIMYLDMN